MTDPSYKSSSLLSLYLTESQTETPDSNEPNVPKIHILGDEANSSPQSSTHKPNAARTNPGKSFASPVTFMHSPKSPVSYVSLGPDRNRLSFNADAQEMGATLGREISGGSFGQTTGASSISAANSLYSSINTFSDDEDLDLSSIRRKVAAVEIEPKKSDHKHSLKGLLRKKEEVAVPLTEDEIFFQQIQDGLKKQNYFCDKKSTLSIDYLQSCEIFFFGSPLNEIFFTESELLSYLLQSTYELGEVRFSNLKRYHEIKQSQMQVDQMLRELLPNLARFGEVLDLYAESQKNVNRPELFEVFSNYANSMDGGLCLPLAISMFGNWLLTYNKDSTLSSNYENTLILDYFRKAARLSLVVLKCRPIFERHSSSFSKSELIELTRYWGKDNLNSLGASLHGLGEYYQYIHEYDVATTLWEMNCHLTNDAESGNLAVLGLTDGYGYGNKMKHRNRLGKKSKTERYNTKRRIAQIYRILMKNPKFDEYGVSWATKSKYD